MWTFFIKLRERLQTVFLLSDGHSILVWSVGAGVLGALATLLFHAGINAMQWAFTGKSSSFPDMARALPPFFRVVIPALGGLFAGWVLVIAQKGVAKDEHLEYIETVAIGNGKIPVKQSLLRSFSSLLTIGSGGSIGRENPMVQLAALAASLVGRFGKFDTDKLRLIVACGAAAGITAAYSAPIASSIFICEIVLGSIAVESFGPVVVSAVVSNIVMREFSGYHAPYMMPAFPAVAGFHVVFFVILGLFCGVLGPFFLNFLKFSQRQFSKVSLPLPIRMCLGGVGVGIIALWVPDVWGNGYSVVNEVLHTNWSWKLLLLIFFAKLIATGLTAGSGALGGKITPTIFMGAMFGFLYGLLIKHFIPGSGPEPFAYAMVSMGATLTGATQAPLMAILMIFEMTMSYQVMLPLMLACVVAYFVSRALGKSAMYEITTHRLKDSRERVRLLNLTAKDLVCETQTITQPNTPIKEIIKIFCEYPVKYIYLVDESNKYQGDISLKDITTDLFAKREIENIPVEQYRRHQIPLLTTEMPLPEILNLFSQFPGERLPVVDNHESLLFQGVIYKTELLTVYKKLMRNELNAMHTI